MTTANRPVLACDNSRPRERQAQNNDRVQTKSGMAFSTYVSTVTFTREEMNEAFARARNQERTTYRCG